MRQDNGTWFYHPSSLLCKIVRRTLWGQMHLQLHRERLAHKQDHTEGHCWVIHSTLFLYMQPQEFGFVLGFFVCLFGGFFCGRLALDYWISRFCYFCFTSFLHLSHLLFFFQPNRPCIFQEPSPSQEITGTACKDVGPQGHPDNQSSTKWMNTLSPLVTDAAPHYRSVNSNQYHFELQLWIKHCMQRFAWRDWACKMKTSRLSGSESIDWLSGLVLPYLKLWRKGLRGTWIVWKWLETAKPPPQHKQLTTKWNEKVWWHTSMKRWMYS